MKLPVRSLPQLRVLFKLSIEKSKSDNQNIIQADFSNHFSAGDDAYSFTDDEEDSKPLPASAVISEKQIKEQRLEAEVSQRLVKINNAHFDPGNRARVGSDETQHQQVAVFITFLHFY